MTTHFDEMIDELASFADMIEFIDRIKGKVSGSEQFKVENIRATLIAAAKIVTCETAEEEAEAIDELNNIMR